MALVVRSRTFGGWLSAIETDAKNLKNRATHLRTRSEAGPVNFFAIDDFMTHLRTTRDLFADAAAEPGLRAWVATQRGGDEASTLADYVAVRNAVISTITWMVDNIPKSGAYLLVLSYAADGEKVGREFGTPALAQFRTRLQALEDTITIG